MIHIAKRYFLNVIAFLIIGLSCLSVADQGPVNPESDMLDAHVESLTAGSLVFLAAAYKARLSLFGCSMPIGIGYSMLVLEDSAQRDKDRKLADKYSGVDEWYRALVQKYPQAQFDKYKVLESSKRKDFTTAGSNFFIDSSTLEKINKIYQKKLNHELLSDEEQSFLSSTEWGMLHEAGHVHHNDLYNEIAVKALLCIGIEGLYQTVKYKKAIPSFCSKNIMTKSVSAVCLYFVMRGVYDSVKHPYQRFVERRADSFANQIADVETLQAARQERLRLDAQRSDVVYDTHPSDKSRAQAILQEINRRQQ